MVPGGGNENLMTEKSVIIWFVTSCGIPNKHFGGHIGKLDQIPC